MGRESRYISWPTWWRGKGKHFLEGCPVFGTHLSIINAAKRTMSFRINGEYLDEWLEHGKQGIDFDHISKEIFKLMRPFIKWPNYMFYPNDSSAIVMGVIPGVWYDIDDILKDFHSTFVIGVNEINVSSAFDDFSEAELCLWDNINNYTYLDFIKNIKLR